MNKMSSNTFRTRRLPTINIENFVKNTKNNSLITNRKRSALKVLTNTVKSVKKCDGNYLKRSLFAKKFDTETKCKSPLHDTAFGRCEEFSHFGCTLQEKDFLPMSMTCNMDMLSDFFNSKNNDKGDFFIDDYNNIMINKIKNTFEKFGEPEHCLPSLPVIDLNFPEILSF